MKGLYYFMTPKHHWYDPSDVTSNVPVVRIYVKWFLPSRSQDSLHHTAHTLFEPGHTQIYLSFISYFPVYSSSVVKDNKLHKDVQALARAFLSSSSVDLQPIAR